MWTLRTSRTECGLQKCFEWKTTSSVFSEKQLPLPSSSDSLVLVFSNSFAQFSVYKFGLVKVNTCQAGRLTPIFSCVSVCLCYSSQYSDLLSVLPLFFPVCLQFKVDGEWWTWIDYERFQRLIQEYDESGGTTSFSAMDYMAKTPSWAVFGAQERGFDPLDTRFQRKNKTKDISGCWYYSCLPTSSL